MSDRYRDSLADESRAEERDLSVPPHDVQAEQAVLGSILKNPRSIHQILDMLVPEAFYDARNRLIYAAAVALVQQEVGIDYHTLSAELQRLGAYDRAGGLLYLSEINLATPSAAHIEHYGRIVADHYTRRRTIAVAQTIAEHAWRANEPVDDLLAHSQAAMLGLSDQPGMRVKSSTAG